MDLQAAIDLIWEATRQGIYYPSDWKGKLSLQEGYQIQLGLLARHIKAGETQVGWKVGPIAKAIQDQLDYHDPVFGFLLQSSERTSECVLVFDELMGPCFETELCLTVGATLKGPGITQEQARQAITVVQPAFEIVERRGDFAADPAMSVIDNVQQKYFVTGPETPLAPDLDLADTLGEIVVNGEQVDQALGSSVMGDPAASVAWLANELAKYEVRLEAGMRIMSGSMTRQHPVGQGDYIEADLQPFGRVAAEFQ